MKTDHWFYSLFQDAPDLITLLLHAAGLGMASAAPKLGPDSPGDQLYRFEAVEFKAVNHRLDGVLWPRQSETGTPQHPVVKLELQMHSKPGFKHRLGAQTLRFLQLHPQVQFLAVVVVVPHRRLNLSPGPLPRQLQQLLDEVIWLSLEELGSQPDIDPLLNLLTLSVRPELEAAANAQQILERRPDLLSAVLPMLFERFPTLTPEEIMVIAGMPTEQLRHTRAAQMLLDEGRQEEAANLALRQLNRRCGPLSEATTARIQALRLEALADALLDFRDGADLDAWLAQHTG